MNIYATRQWVTVRAHVLHRDRYRCKLAYPCCVFIASEVDHIIEVDAGGAPYDPRNLRAACKPCNSSRGASYGNRKREPQDEPAYW